MPYFDHNATTPLLPAARDAWLRASDEAWANPSSPYRLSARVHRLLEGAREQIAQTLGCAPGELLFTSGATEANNAVIGWAARRLPASAPVLVSPLEHPSVLETSKVWLGDRAQLLELGDGAAVDVAGIAHRLAHFRGGLVAVMAANNETGVLQPGLHELDEICHARGVWFLCDATQWIGRLPTDGLPRHAFLVASAHKFGGPKGVGLLRVPGSAAGFHGQRGGEQEHGRRAGTENFPAIAGLAAALEHATNQPPGDRPKIRREFISRIQERVPGTIVNSGAAACLWNTVSLRLPAHENTRWVTRLDKLGFEVSTGSACATGNIAPSHVLAALGLSADEARRSIRVSAGWETTAREWELLAEAIGNVWEQFTAEGGASVIVPPAP